MTLLRFKLWQIYTKFKIPLTLIREVDFHPNKTTNNLATWHNFEKSRASGSWRSTNARHLHLNWRKRQGWRKLLSELLGKSIWTFFWNGFFVAQEEKQQPLHIPSLPSTRFWSIRISPTFRNPASSSSEDSESQSKGVSFRTSDTSRRLVDAPNAGKIHISTNKVYILKLVEPGDSKWPFWDG